jgi:hypothetical protein
VSETYLRRVNVTSVRNVTEIRNVTNNNVIINNFVNRGGATMVPAAAMAASQPIAQRAQRVTPEMLASARPVQAMPVRPTAATLGVTPAVARQFNITPAGGAFGGRPVASGPVVTARPEGGRVGTVVLRAPGGAPVVTNGANGAEVARPGEIGRPNAERLGAPGPSIMPREGEAAGRLLPSSRPEVPVGIPGVVRPGEGARPGEPMRPDVVARPGEPARPAAPEARPAVEPPRPEAGAVARPPVAARPAEMPHVASPTPRPEPHPEPRPAMARTPRPMPAPRPEARPESHPPMQHVAMPPRPAPQRREEPARR